MEMEKIYKKLDFDPNGPQREAIETTEGPLLIVAGPGSGKTQCLILRTINLLVNKKVPSEDILVCTFTEKAALQLKSRIANIIDKLNYDIDTSDIVINTIHGFCNEVLGEFTDCHLRLNRGFEVLDEIMQKFFINDNFTEIVKNSTDDDREKKYLDRWHYKWNTVENLINYFNKLTQELISPQALIDSDDIFFKELGNAYHNYRELLSEKNYTDFAFLQYYLNDLLENQDTREQLLDRFKYIMVDEFQDTNYIQEKILYDLIEKTNNICVVGDEDQSLYRFRGATVRNLLEFPKHFPDYTRVTLSKNYRSHAQIIQFYDSFMNSINWGNARFNKKIVPCQENMGPLYNSVFKINGNGQKNQAEKVAEFIKELKEREVINDLSEVVILIDSVKPKYSKSFIESLEDEDIKVHCPRAKQYFNYEEIRCLIAVFLEILDFSTKAVGFSLDWKSYLQEVKAELNKLRQLDQYKELDNWLDQKKDYYNRIYEEQETTDEDLLDVMYQVFRYLPFKNYLKAEGLAKFNLGIMSDLLAKFNKFYLRESQIITFRNVRYIARVFFQSFLYVLHKTGLNEYEDREKILVKNHVSIMTIHQAKGLEFPVVIVSNIGKQTMQSGKLDKELVEFKHRDPFEDHKKINDFDYMRQYYVAFSRAENFLALSKYRKRANPKVRRLYNNLNNLEKIDKPDWDQIDISPKEETLLKKQYGLTTDILVYDNCPRQYDFYKRAGFVSSRKGGALFGSLVHDTIEDIHNHHLDNNMGLDEKEIENIFEENYSNLREHMQQTLAPKVKEAAYRQIIKYYQENKDIIEDIDEAEVSITLEKPGYFIGGKIDIVINQDGRYKLIDLKAQQPDDSEPRLKRYKLQLATYCNLLKQKHGIDVDETMIYWTGAEDSERAKLYFKIEEDDIAEADNHFDQVVAAIENGQFEIEEKPGKVTCKECDFRFYCG